MAKSEASKGFFPRKRRYILLLISALVTTPLIWKSLSPNKLIKIQVQPQQNDAVNILPLETSLHTTINSPIFFEFVASIDDPSIERVNLCIRPSDEQVCYQQKGFSISNGQVSGIAQLGSQEYPVVKPEHYTYKLYTIDNNILSNGKINVDVNRVVESEIWLITGIGLFASIVQILSMFNQSYKEEVV